MRWRHDLMDLLNTPTPGGPLWLWIVLGIGIGAALFGYPSGDHDGCPPLAGRC